MNQELEQYLWFFVDYRQKDWPEWLVSAEFVVNSKVHTATKILPFMANYRRELRIEGDIRKKGKVEKATEFVERMKKIHEEARAVFKKAQEDMKRQADRGRKKTKDWKKGDKVLLSMKDLVFKKRLVRKLLDQYLSPYTIEEVVSTNIVKLQLPTSMKIYLVVNVSRIVQYKEQVEGQKKEEGKPIEVEGVEEWKVEKILNKRKIREVDKYLVRWKKFMVEHDTWEKSEALGNTRETLEEFEGRMNVKLRRQEKLDIAEEKNFRRGELPEKYIAKMLYKWDDGKFEEKYLRKLAQNWQRWNSVSLEKKPQRRGNVKIARSGPSFSYFIFLFLFSF